MKVQGAGGILMKILSSRIRTKSGGACSIGTRKGARVWLAKRPQWARERRPQRRNFSPAAAVASVAYGLKEWYNTREVVVYGHRQSQEKS